MAPPADDWFGPAFTRAWKDKAEEMGRFNLAIFGKMGHARLRVCERMARGELGVVGGALDGDGIRRVSTEEFRARASRRRLPS
jgi:hypothetical protein